MKILAIILVSSLAISYAFPQQQNELLTGEFELTSEDESLLFEQYLYEYALELHNLQLSEISFEERKSIFVANLEKIIAHNKNNSKSYSKGINKFTGLTRAETQNYILRAPQNCSATARATLEVPTPNLRRHYADVPATQDWRTQGVVTEVKDQGGCGSCWTFSTTGCLESHWAIKTKQTPPILSEQQLVDCAGNFNNFGCNGGLPAQAFEYIRYNGGLDSETSYPYEGQDGTCRFVQSAIAASVPGGSVNITAYDEQQILQSVGLVGPVSIAFEVTNEFESYSSGVFVDSTCNQDPEHVNHAVLIVGYGSENGQDYWIVKNSWGPSWGEDGYFRIVRGANACGLATCASYPNVYG